MKMSMDAQRLTFHRMTFTEDRDGGGKVADVGSVSCVPSMPSTTNGW